MRSERWKNVRERFLDAIGEAADDNARDRMARWFDSFFVSHLEDHRSWHDWRVCS